MDTSKEKYETEQGPRTLRRGLTVLQTLESGPPEGLNVTNLSRLTGLQRPTLYRLLAALQEYGFVQTVAGTKRYIARPRFTEAGQERDLRIDLCMPAMQALAQRTGDAVFLVVRDGHESLSLWREIGPYPVQILATYAGKRQPLGVGSGGLALLAALDDATVDAIIARNSDRLEHYGGMSARELRRLVDNTRARGYAVVGNHAVRGAVGVACALCDADGQPLLSLSVTAITDRMPALRQREIAQLLREAMAPLLPPQDDGL